MVGRTRDGWADERWLGGREMVGWTRDGWADERWLGGREMVGRTRDGWVEERWLGGREMVGRTRDGWADERWLGGREMVGRDIMRTDNKSPQLEWTSKRTVKMNADTDYAVLFKREVSNIQDS